MTDPDEGSASCIFFLAPDTFLQDELLAASSQRLAHSSPCAGNAVVNVYINKDKNFSFVEFRTGTPGKEQQKLLGWSVWARWMENLLIAAMVVGYQV
jgi:hypothetical protein